jgi:hypothetical protein
MNFQVYWLEGSKDTLAGFIKSLGIPILPSRDNIKLQRACRNNQKIKLETLLPFLATEAEAGAAILLVRKNYTVIPTFLRFLKLRFPDA